MGLLTSHTDTDPTVTFVAARWDYRVLNIAGQWQRGGIGADQLQKKYQQLGDEGWELVSVYEERATFKRPRIA